MGSNQISECPSVEVTYIFCIYQLAMIMKRMFSSLLGWAWHREITVLELCNQVYLLLCSDYVTFYHLCQPVKGVKEDFIGKLMIKKYSKGTPG